jgi:hypothetical protein
MVAGSCDMAGCLHGMCYAIQEEAPAMTLASGSKPGQQQQHTSTFGRCKT